MLTNCDVLNATDIDPVPDRIRMTDKIGFYIQVTKYPRFIYWYSDHSEI